MQNDHSNNGSEGGLCILCLAASERRPCFYLHFIGKACSLPLCFLELGVCCSSFVVTLLLVALAMMLILCFALLLQSCSSDWASSVPAALASDDERLAQSSSFLFFGFHPEP